MNEHLTYEPAAITAEELSELSAVARRFVEEVVRPASLDLDDADPAAIDVAWQGICEIGVDRCLVPEEHGGGGVALEGLMTVLEQLATGDGGVAMLTLLANCAAASLPSDQAEPLAGGERLAYVPLPGDGRASAPAFDGERVTGVAGFAFGVADADGFVVECLNGGERVLVRIEAGVDGVVSAAAADALGLRAARPGRLEFLNVTGRQVGEADDVARCDLVLQAGLAAIAHGIARRAAEMALDYAENRYQGGSMIVEYGAVREMLARMTERESAGLTATGSLGAPRDAASALALKTAVTDAAVATTIDAVQVFGGMGYMRETGAEKLMRDAKYLQLYPTSNWLERDRLLELTRR